MTTQRINLMRTILTFTAVHGDCIMTRNIGFFAPLQQSESLNSLTSLFKLSIMPVLSIP